VEGDDCGDSGAGVGDAGDRGAGDKGASECLGTFLGGESSVLKVKVKWRRMVYHYFKKFISR
jgi:hypothetical protein